MPTLQKKSESNLMLPRVILLLVLDILVLNAAAFLALFIRFEFSFATLAATDYLQVAMRWALPNTLLALGLFASFRLYHTLWSFAGPDELARIFIASILWDCCS